jgi:hypothetical protein
MLEKAKKRISKIVVEVNEAIEFSVYLNNNKNKKKEEKMFF